jgi:hypothetical protein
MGASGESLRSLSFEDLSIRKNYLSRMGGSDFREFFDKFEKNIKITSGMMYKKFEPSFHRCGFDEDDIYSLSKLYSIYYFDLYSDSVGDEESKQRNALITFIRQRVSYLAQICEKKSENFNVYKNLSGFYAKTSKTVEVPDDVVIGNPKEWGYRKVGPKELTSLKSGKKSILKDKDGFEVVKLEFYDSITPEDYENILYKESFTLNSPEDIVIEMSEKYRPSEEINNFDAKSMVNKIEQLKAMRAFTRSSKKRKDIDKLIKMLKNDSGNN